MHRTYPCSISLEHVTEKGIQEVQSCDFGQDVRGLKVQQKSNSRFLKTNMKINNSKRTSPRKGLTEALLDITSQIH